MHLNASQCIYGVKARLILCILVRKRISVDASLDLSFTLVPCTSFGLLADIKQHLFRIALDVKIDVLYRCFFNLGSPESKGYTSTVQGFRQKLHTCYEREYIVTLQCRYVNRGSSHHWNSPLGFCSTKKVEKNNSIS